MAWLLFLFRLSLICGLFFLLSLSHLFRPWMKDEALVSTVITIGYFMGLVIVPLSWLSYGIMALAGKKPGRVVPRWLRWAAALVLLLLLAYIVYVNQSHAASTL